MWPMILLLGGALAVLASGCEKGCSTQCLDGVTVQLPPNTLVQDRPYNFKMCIDGACTCGQVSPIPRGAICTSDVKLCPGVDWLCSVGLGTSSSFTVLFVDRAFLAGDALRQVTLEITAGAETVAKKSGSVSVAPQVAECNTTCRRGTLRAL
jgi:hypothetical protein